ncbi:unnamed protein product [Blepharisma stoltei]|uniref:Uncharacterized protein n=1 Tax=Blepharisma stoltei TaxID=1481888 RepID=A0AAU9JKB1_9CILI|nr:unnamed protein product [Blepharisma stoltei]
MGTCMSSKKTPRIAKAKSEKSQAAIVKQKREILVKKVKNAPILTLEINELYLKRKKSNVHSSACSDTEGNADLMKLNTTCYN